MVYSQHVPNDGAMNINPNAHILPSIHNAFVIHTGINESGKEVLVWIRLSKGRLGP